MRIMAAACLYAQPVREEWKLNAGQQDAGQAREDKGAVPRVQVVVIESLYVQTNTS